MVSIKNTVKTVAAQSTWVFLTLVCCLVLSTVTRADSYDVQASVPYPAPTQSATFNNNPDGTTVQAALLTLSGSCQVANPATVVSIWRGGSSIGSTPCQSGSYTLQVTLVEGLNNLTARTANASNLYGPDSQPISVTLQLPPNPQPPADTAAGDAPTTPAEVIAASNAGAADDLQITTSQPFSVISDSKAVTIVVVVAGGSTPYNIMLNWGDGTTESHSVPSAGSYSYSHTYPHPATYKVHGEVRDSNGAYSTFDYAVVSYKKTITAPSTVTTTPKPNQPNGTIYEIAAGVLIGGFLLGNFGYRIGLRHGARDQPDDESRFLGKAKHHPIAIRVARHKKKKEAK